MSKSDMVVYCQFHGYEAYKYWSDTPWAKDFQHMRTKGFRRLVATPYTELKEFPYLHSSRMPARTIEIDGEELHVCRNCFYNLAGSAPSWLNAGKIKKGRRKLPAIKRKKNQ